MTNEITTKTCNGCEQDLPLDAFNKHPKGVAGRQSKCKVCNAAYYQDYYQEHKERMKAQAKAYRVRRNQVDGV